MLFTAERIVPCAVMMIIGTLGNSRRQRRTNSSPPRHLEIGEDDIEIGFLQIGQRRFRGFRREHLIPGLFEHHAHDRLHVLLVIDNKNRTFHASPSLRIELATAFATTPASRFPDFARDTRLPWRYPVTSFYP